VAEDEVERQSMPLTQQMERWVDSLQERVEMELKKRLDANDDVESASKKALEIGLGVIAADSAAGLIPPEAAEAAKKIAAGLPQPSQQSGNNQEADVGGQ
jgi:hypothetical protein